MRLIRDIPSICGTFFFFHKINWKTMEISYLYYVVADWAIGLKLNLFCTLGFSALMLLYANEPSEARGLISKCLRV